jgi:hypothetical protein
MNSAKCKSQNNGPPRRHPQFTFYILHFAFYISLLSFCTSSLLAAEFNVQSPTAPDVAVVCPAVFRQALKPWWDYRTAEGHRLALVSNAGSPDDIRQRITLLAKGGRLRFVV